MATQNPTPGTGGGGNPPVVSADAATPKRDIYGSTFTRGISSNRFDRAVTRCLVRNVRNDFRGLNEAINAAILNRGHYEPAGTGFSILPLAYAKARRFGPSKVWVDLYYQRGRVTQPTQEVQEIASFRGTHEHTIVYRKKHEPGPDDPPGGIWVNDLPSGDPYFEINTQGVTEPVGRAWRRPVIKIYVTDIILNQHPFGLVSGAIGRVNGSTDDGHREYTIGNFRFPAYSLRFDSVDVDWIETFAYNQLTGEEERTVAYITDYVFSATPGGWFNQQITSVPGFGGWSVTGDADLRFPNNQEYETWEKGLTFPWQP